MTHYLSLEVQFSDITITKKKLFRVLSFHDFEYPFSCVGLLSVYLIKPSREEKQLHLLAYKIFPGK